MLEVPEEEITFRLRGFGVLPWAEFVLNPRRLRGSDFLMRWSQGAWSEDRIIQAVNSSEEFYVIPYGPSGVAPSDDPREFELYFERLEKAKLGDQKRPDLLIFTQKTRKQAEALVGAAGGSAELPFTPEEKLRDLLDTAICAVECENSLWRAERMPDFGKEMKPQKRLGGLPGFKKSAVLPTIIVKEEDLGPLKKWQGHNGIPIHVWHAFYDAAYGISLERIKTLVDEGRIEPTKQVFQAPGGPTTEKNIYKVYYCLGYNVGRSVQEPTLRASYLEDKNGHILPYVRFEGGKMTLNAGALAELRKLRDSR